MPLLGTYPEKTIIQKDTYTPMLVAGQKHGSKLNIHQQKNGLKKMWYIYTMEYYSVINSPFLKDNSHIGYGHRAQSGNETYVEFMFTCILFPEKAMAPHSSTFA